MANEPIKPGEVLAGLGQSIKDMKINMPPFAPGRMIMLEDSLMVVHSGYITTNRGQVDAVTEDASYILNALPDLLTTFLLKNRKYASVEDGYDLGPAGIIPDLNRKLGILVDRLWEGNPTVGEETDEVIGDMIGHLWLMLAKIAREED